MPFLPQMSADSAQMHMDKIRVIYSSGLPRYIGQDAIACGKLSGWVAFLLPQLSPQILSDF
jgi:hypothetical protein